MGHIDQRLSPRARTPLSRLLRLSPTELAFHHMIGSGESRGLGSIRPAIAADASELALIRGRSVSRESSESLDATGLLTNELDFIERLSIPHGEDYFCFVVDIEGESLGYVIGGGSRDLDRKAHGEIYELAVASRAPDHVGRRLMEAAFSNFDEAAFAGTLVTLAVSDQQLRFLAVQLGMREDPAPNSGNEAVRYERPLRGSDLGQQ